jgi:ATP-dependent exoDNAse (exonuclease V) beta subunit
MGRLYALADVEAPEDAVEIMTIHKAKGLEFDTVIVPGLDRLPRAGPRPLFAWKSLPGARLLLAPINASGTDKEPAYNYVRELEREAEDIESGRLFYVAATRAKRQLHLMSCAKTDKEDGSLREPARRSLGAKIWWQAREHFGPAPEQADDAPRAPLPDLLRRFPAGLVLPSIPESSVWKEAQPEGTEEPIEFSWAGETARHVGSVVHRWLQRIAEDQMHGWDAVRVSSLESRFSMQLESRGVPQADLKESVRRVTAALKNTIADERGRWLLGPQKDASSERRLRVAGRGTAGISTFIVDRVFRDEKGALWVVDWKTSRHEGKGLEAFLDSEQARYAPQLERYGAALGATRLGLYFPALARWREWESAPPPPALPLE